MAGSVFDADSSVEINVSGGEFRPSDLRVATVGSGFQVRGFDGRVLLGSGAGQDVNAGGQITGIQGAPEIGNIAGDNDIDYFSQNELNPFLFGGSNEIRQTPAIEALLGGAELYGFLDGLEGQVLSEVFDFDANVTGQNAADSNGLVAVYRVDFSAEQVLGLDINGDGEVGGEDYTGFDMLLVINLTDINLPAPRIGVHLPGSTDTTLTHPLLFKGAFEQTPVELTALNAQTAWVTLIPEEATTVTASIAGTTVANTTLTSGLITNVTSKELSTNSVTYITAGRPNLDEFLTETTFERFVEVQPSADGRHN